MITIYSLPEDTLVEILRYLPDRSHMLFAHVCKKFRSAVSTQVARDWYRFCPHDTLGNLTGTKHVTLKCSHRVAFLCAARNGWLMIINQALCEYTFEHRLIRKAVEMAKEGKSPLVCKRLLSHLETIPWDDYKFMSREGIFVNIHKVVFSPNPMDLMDDLPLLIEKRKTVELNVILSGTLNVVPVLERVVKKITVPDFMYLLQSIKKIEVVIKAIMNTNKDALFVVFLNMNPGIPLREILIKHAIHTQKIHYVRMLMVKSKTIYTTMLYGACYTDKHFEKTASTHQLFVDLITLLKETGETDLFCTICKRSVTQH
jgi:hypothetical protein